MFSSKNQPHTWTPNPIHVATLRAEIESKLSGNDCLMPDPEFLDACAKIGCFLMDTNAVMVQLKKLNKCIADRSLTGLLPMVHTLRRFLEIELMQYGFQPHLGKASQLLQPHVFRATLCHGLFFKDTFLGSKMHGEFTHAIQWLLISWQQETSNFLGLDDDHRRVVTLFKKLGQFNCYYRQRNNTLKGIWDLISDRPPNNNMFGSNDEEIITSASLDFRRPEDLNYFVLKSSDRELLALKVLLSIRSNKRRDEDFATLKV